MLSALLSSLQGLTLEKKARGQLAPKFLDLVASTNFLVAKNYRGKRLKTIQKKKTLNVICFISLLFIDQLSKNIFRA